MQTFNHRNNRLFAEDVDLTALAEVYGTPCYVYSRAALEERWRAFDQAFAGCRHLVCYAVKANSNLAVLNLLVRLGSGFDIVSGGELERVLAAGGDPGKVIFSGVGKNTAEMQRALEAGILCFNVESEAELEHLNEIAARLGRRAPVSLRVNPDIDARTHPYISTGLAENKFGIDITAAHEVYRRAAAMTHIEVVGVDCHIGSQLTEVEPFVEALDRVLALVDILQDDGITLRHLDLGGGLGIRYSDETALEPMQYATALLARLKDRDYQILIEPGRAIIGNAGILLTRVEYIKHSQHKNFVIVDAAMNDLMRPALYDAYHAIHPVQGRSGETQIYDVVGPVCESGDFLGRDRSLSVQRNDLLAIFSAGAYGMSMSSNYNTRPRAAEVIVDGAHHHLVRAREMVTELFAGEKLLP
ncbi:MAG: diaminopimelate decarboxylase [Gammaproteobacteria bacterium]